SASSAALAGVLVVPTTSWPAWTRTGTNARPTAPVAPARKMRMWFRRPSRCPCDMPRSAAGREVAVADPHARAAARVDRGECVEPVHRCWPFVTVGSQPATRHPGHETEHQHRSEATDHEESVEFRRECDLQAGLLLDLAD